MSDANAVVQAARRHSERGVDGRRWDAALDQGSVRVQRGPRHWRFLQGTFRKLLFSKFNAFLYKIFLFLTMNERDHVHFLIHLITTRGFQRYFDEKLQL